MFILVKESLPLLEMRNSALVLDIKEDGKTFKVIRHPSSNIVNTEHHISMLKHFILSVQEEKDEETDRVSGSQA